MGKEVKVRFLVDSGATYSLLHDSVWKSLKLEPKGSVTFTFAHGTMRNCEVFECFVVFPGGEGHSPVILGEAGDQALPGASGCGDT